MAGLTAEDRKLINELGTGEIMHQFFPEQSAEFYDKIINDDLPEEELNEFSNAPLEFEDKAKALWEDTQLMYYHACKANRFSDKYLKYCASLETRIKKIGTYCLIKAVLEHQGQKIDGLESMNIRELIGMTSFHFRKSHAAFRELYEKQADLGMTYLNWEFRWADLGERLEATEVKIRGISEGSVNVEKMLQSSQVFHDAKRTNINSDDGKPQSLPLKASALPFDGSLARNLKGYYLKRATYYRKLARVGVSGLRKHGTEEDLKHYYPELYQKEDPLETQPVPDQKSESGETHPAPDQKISDPPVEQDDDEQQVTEAEARKILIEDAMRRKDQKALMEIPKEDSWQIYDRWVEILNDPERRRFVLSKFNLLDGPGGKKNVQSRQRGPSNDTRKKLREKRKKKK